MTLVYGEPGMGLHEILLPNGAVVPEEPHNPLMPLANTAKAMLCTWETADAALKTNRGAIDDIAARFRYPDLTEVLAVGSGDSLQAANYLRDCLDELTAGEVAAQTLNALKYAARGHRGGAQTLGLMISSTGREGEATEVLARARGGYGTALGMVALMTDAITGPYAERRPDEIVLRPGAIGPGKAIPTRTTLTAMMLAADLSLAIAGQRGYLPGSETSYWRDDILRGRNVPVETPTHQEFSHSAMEWSFDVAKMHEVDPDANVLSTGEGSDYTLAKLSEALMSAGPQVTASAKELGETDHALCLSSTKPNDLIVLLATEGIDGVHAQRFLELEADGRRPLLIGTFLGSDEAASLKGSPYLFETPYMRRPLGALYGAVVLQWLAMALAVRRVESGYQRTDRVRALSMPAIRSHVNLSRQEL